jgi:hypothetical protein
VTALPRARFRLVRRDKERRFFRHDGLCPPLGEHEVAQRRSHVIEVSRLKAVEKQSINRSD